jgi:hypothetical protein
VYIPVLVPVGGGVLFCQKLVCDCIFPDDGYMLSETSRRNDDGQIVFQPKFKDVLKQNFETRTTVLKFFLI